MIGFLLGHWGIISGLLGAGGGVLSMFFPAQALLAIKAVWAWLCHRSFWQLMFGAALILAGWEYIGKRAEQRHSVKVEAQLAKATGELNRLRAESKAQQVEVAKTVDHYITVEKPVIRKEVERIESAPLKGGCQTPDAVMEAGV